MQTAVDWLNVYPEGMEKMVTYLKHRYNNTPMYITENGEFTTYMIQYHIVCEHVRGCGIHNDPFVNLLINEFCKICRFWRNECT